MKKILFNSFLLTLAIIILNACSTGHGHFDANGVVLFIDGEEVARQELSTVTYTTGSSVTLEHGESVVVSVQFLDDDNSLVIPDDPDNFLQLVIANESVISKIGENRSEYTVTLEPTSVGETNIQFEVWHVDHSDYTSQPFLFTVVEDGQ